jgi:iron-sulfur cluster repair protein YtfE (RIC family)
MASIDRSDPVILGHVLAEHRDLFNLMSSVRSAFAAEATATPDRQAVLLSMLHQLRDHLHDHFAQEEEGGFLEEAVTRIPRLSAAVRSILRQHPDLLAELDRVIDAVESPAEPAEPWSRAGAAFEVFSAHMTAHERSENAVVQEGYNEDLGLVEQ